MAVSGTTPDFMVYVPMVIVSHIYYCYWGFTFRWLYLQTLSSETYISNSISKLKMADSKKTPPILNIFSLKFQGLVLGLVGQIDAKGINVALPIWPSGCLTWAQKRTKNTKNAFWALFWAYIRHPDSHIGWATLMPFASIYSTN